MTRHLRVTRITKTANEPSARTDPSQEVSKDGCGRKPREQCCGRCVRSKQETGKS